MAMTATLANDDSGGTVWYYFECTSSGLQGCGNSGWQTNRTYTASGLAAGTQYGFRVKAKDATGNQTGWSGTSSATTLSTEMHVDQVALALKQKGRKEIYAEATIIIREKGGFPVPSAQVQVSWSGSVLGNSSATTDAQGVVKFSSSALPRTSNIEFRITVNNVSHGNYTYKPASNVEGGACIVTLKRNEYAQCE